MRQRRNLTLSAVALAVAVWPAAALAGNPHGTPPGQEKKDSGSGSVHGNAHAHGNAHVKAHGHASAHATVHVKVHGNASAHGNGHVKVHGNVSAHGNGHVKVHGNASAHGNGHVKVHGNASAHGTFAAAGSGQTKLYGNGQSAAEIAIANGAQADTMLFGPGNSQLHKVMCGSHWIDVHALKAHAGACAGAEGSMGDSGQVNIHGHGMNAAQIALAARLGLTLVAVGNSGPHKVSCNGHLIDVHALKAHACAGAGGNAGAGVQSAGQVSAGVSGQAQGTAQIRAGTKAGAKAGGVLGASSSRPTSRPSSAGSVLGASTSSGNLPFTGLSLGFATLLGIALIAGGLGITRAARARS